MKDDQERDDLAYVCFCAAGKIIERGNFPGILQTKMIGKSGPWWDRKPVMEYIRGHIHQ